MKCVDFEFDGRYLSEFGLILCHFGSTGLETIDGAEITFNTVSVQNGKKHEQVSTEYESVLESVFQVCKHSCAGGIEEITDIEHREIVRWLNRHKFLKLKLLDENNIDIYHEATFPSISKIEIDGRLVGLELSVLTNRPFALKEPRVITIANTIESGALQKVYKWKEYAIIEDSLIETSVSAATIGYKSEGSQEWNYITYANDIDIINGRISLKNPTEISMGHSSITTVIKGKYIYVDGKYFKVPSASTIIRHPNIVVASNIRQLKVEDLRRFIKEVSSEDSDAYPADGVQNGNYYVYIGEYFIQNKKHSIFDTSHEEGYIYPYTKITILEDGDLEIYNALEDRTTHIGNCVAGEVITMNYPIVQSTLESHKVQNDFNWNWFRIANTYENRRNDLSISLPCIIKIEYSPIIKVGL